MSKRQRRSHEAEGARRPMRSAKERWLLIVLVAVVVLLVVAGAAVLLIQTPWMAAHRTQVLGGMGLIVLAVLLSLPIVIEYERHPRHLSGPGKNPEQGPGPWKIGRG